MSLLSLTFKNIKGNFKNYTIYFISMLFSITIFYTFISLQNSEDVQKALETKVIGSAFLLASILLVVFIYIFIWYSNKHFSNLRKKEIGLYSLLGLSKRKIASMLFLENLLLGVFVLVLGIILGSFLTQLFTMILLNLLKVDQIVTVSISSNAIIITFLVFMLLSLLNSLQSYLIIYKYQLIDLFSADKQKEIEPKTSVFLSIVSIVLILIGYYYASQPFIDTTQILTNMVIITISLTVGTILFFIYFSVTFFNLLRKRKKIYYKGMNIISISSLAYQMKSYALTLSTVSILAVVTLLAFTMGFGSYFTSIELTEQENPFDYYYPSTNLDNELDQIITTDSEHPVINHSEITYATIGGTATNTKIISGREKNIRPDFIKVISESNYNNIAQIKGFEQLDDIKPGNAGAVQPLYTGNEESDYLNEQITLKNSQYDKTYTFTSFTTNRIINWTYPDIMIIIDDYDYNQLLNYTTTTTDNAYLIENPQTAKETTQTLEEYDTDEFHVSSYYRGYRTNVNTGGTNAFIFTFLGIIFILSTGSILYFKQLSTSIADSKRFEVLKQIGVSDRDITKSILIQNIFIFCAPILIGSIHYAVLARYISSLVSNLMLVNLPVIIISCIFIFLLIYILYFFLTVSSYLKNVINKPFRKIYSLIVIVLVFILIFALLLLFN